MKKSAFRAVCVLTAAILLFAAFPLAGFAADKAIDSGSCGSGVTWTFYEDGTLRISGSGPMADYNGFMDEYGDHCICYDYQGDGMFLNIIRFLCAFYNFVLEMQAAFGA